MTTSTATRKNTNAATKRRIQATIIAVHGTACAACERETIVGASPNDGRGFNLGHVRAEANGGSFTVANLLPICRRCNVYMSDVDWADSGAPMLVTPMDAPLVADPGTVQTHMDRPDWA
jgi:hypothetical protein